MLGNQLVDTGGFIVEEGGDGALFILRRADSNKIFKLGFVYRWDRAGLLN